MSRNLFYGLGMIVLLFGVNAQGKSIHCDKAAAKAALEAHAKQYPICEETGCDVVRTGYKGRLKKRVKIDSKTYLKTTKIKRYEVSVADEVETEHWGILADSSTEKCEIKKVWQN